MLAQDLNSYVKAAPFRPFRIRMNGGKTYDVRHPELIRLTRTTAFVFPSIDEDGIVDRPVMLGVELFEDVSTIDTPVAPHPPGDAGG